MISKMKPVFWTLVWALSYASAFAGPDFGTARKSFDEARRAVIEDLGTDPAWNCISYSVDEKGRDRAQVLPGLYHFKILGDSSRDNLGTHPAKNFAQETLGVSASLETPVIGVETLHVRVLKNGNLINEWTGVPWRDVVLGEIIGNQYPPALSDSSGDRRALSYEVCTTDQLPTP